MKAFEQIQQYVSEHPWIKRWVLNKYVITLLLFGVFIMFVGDQSVVKQIKRGRQIRSLEQQIKQSRENIDAYRNELDYLAQPDSLERFAREHYHMHAPNEDVYIVR